MKLPWLILVALVINAVSVFGQLDPCHKTTEGTDFWFGFMEGRNYNSGHYNQITLTSGFTCNYQIFIGKSATPSFTGTVQPNTPVMITIDWHLVETVGSEVIEEKAIHLVSDNPLNIYALNWSDSSSEVAMIYPTNSLGNEYYAMCYTPHINGNGINSGNGRNSEFLVVASQDNTIVNITPTKVTDKLKPANVPLPPITLNRGEVYQVQSDNLPNMEPAQGDLTGSYITSNKPVAVYSGSLSTTVPYGTSVSAWDHLYEQMPPLQTWGRKFITVPLKTRHEDTYRILPSKDTTTIRIGNQPPRILLQKGVYYEFSLAYTEPTLIESDKPILLAQFSNSNTVDKTFTGGDGDPFMVIISSVDQTREKVAFVAYESAKINSKFFINVVVKDDAAGAIMIDNSVLSFTPIAGTGYSYVQYPLQKGPHNIVSTVPGKGFIAWVYGFGGVEAYGYGVGYNLDIVLDLGSNINANGSKLLIRCEGDPPKTIDAGNAFDKYKWDTGNPGDTTSVIRVANAGWYKLTASTNSGCIKSDSVEVRISKPSVFLGRDTTICNPSTILLDAGADFDSYLWSTPGSQPTTRTIVASNPGTYSVNAKNLYGCPAIDSIKVSFADKPKIFSNKVDTLMCGKYSTVLDVSADKNVSWSLESTDPKVNISGLSVSVAPADQGRYPVILTAKDTFSCVSTKAFNLGFFKSPVVNLGNDSTICNPESIKLNAGEGFASYIWSTKETTPGIIVKKDSTYSVKIIDVNGCTASDSVKIAFTNKPQFTNLASIDTLICGKFTTTLNLSADKPVTYSLESSNPKVNINGLTASVAPADQGTYPVLITAKDQFSCTSSASKNIGFYKTPKVGFTIDDKTCSGYNLDVSYVGDVNIPSSNFNWVFGGVDIANATGLSSLIVPLGVNRSQRDLSLIVTENGCSNTFTQKDVKVIPNLTMHIVDTLGCEPFKTQFMAHNTEVVVYDWDFGDGTPVQRLDSLPFHTYQKAGFYNVDLKVTTIVSSGAGCVNEVRIDSAVHVAPIPTVGFSLDPSICLEKTDHQVSYVGSGDQKDTYNWDLSAFDSSEIIQNPGKMQGPFTFNLINKPKAPISLQVLSKYGCISETGKIEVKRKPSFSFTAAENRGCKPLDASFSASAGDPVDQISYTWDFGDGTTGTGSSISHTYSEPDHHYTVSLSGLSMITGCSDNMTSDTLVFVFPKPVAGFTLDNSIVYNDKPEVKFKNESQSADHYLWDFSEGTTSQDVDPSYKFKGHGYKKVLLQAFNSYQCSDTISHEVLVALSRIFPPNAFSPNAPSEVDREFKLSQEAIKEEGYHLIIMSRWDDIVFETKNEIKGWDGKLKNGNFAPAGSYVWVLDFIDFLGRKHQQSGTVTILY